MSNMSDWRIPAADTAKILRWVKGVDHDLMDNVFQEEVTAVCRKWAADVGAIDNRQDRLAYFQDELPALLSKRALFEGVLKGITNGKPYPDVRQETFFDNEVILYRDPARLFSLRLYIFGAGEHTSVHDHTSWGVSGSAFGQLEVVRYRREDDGLNPDQAQLTLAGRLVLWPGEIETTLPLDQGIHSTGSTNEETTLMVSVYGTPLRRLYIQRFNLESGSVRRLFSPRLKKKMLAEQALKAMETTRTSN
jgi:predicted metal-dependent enzyme (double-stranded beta helix superfamily)